MKLYSTPVCLMSDAYTISSHMFESPEALTYSKYYLTFRKFPSKKEPDLFREDDNRIVFMGISTAINKLFEKPVTHSDIDQCVAFCKQRKYMTNGLADFDFPEKEWRQIVDKFGGRPPLKITALPEGSVCYPHEPVVRVENTVEGFGQFAGYFEIILINYIWSQTARLTAARHWLERNIEMIMNLEKCTYDEALPKAQIMMHDFGGRAAMCNEESESLGLVHLLCFGGTDTFAGAYQAWMNGAASYVGGSVWALAHRIVQGFVKEGDCYENIYENAPNNSIISMVADCYDYKKAVLKYLIPLALRSKAEGNGKIVVVRPDSGDAKEQILWTLIEADKAGLVVTQPDGLKACPYLRIIEGDSMNYSTMTRINEAVIRAGYAPHLCYIYGVGGYLRNSITRDDMSTKYALCAVGCDKRYVVKVSEVAGKTTLPDCSVVRDTVALESGFTIRSNDEHNWAGDLYGEKDIHQVYYDWDGTQKSPFSAAMDDNFNIVQARVIKEFNTRPGIGGKISGMLSTERAKILEQYK